MIDIEKKESIGYQSSVEKGFNIIKGIYIPVEFKPDQVVNFANAVKEQVK